MKKSINSGSCIVLKNIIAFSGKVELKGAMRVLTQVIYSSPVVVNKK